MLKKMKKKAQEREKPLYNAGYIEDNDDSDDCYNQKKKKNNKFLINLLNGVVKIIF